MSEAGHDERLALDVLDRHRAEEARVARVGAVVPHREDTSLRDHRRAEEARVGELLVHVGLVLDLAVDGELTVADGYLVALDGYYPLDQVVPAAIFVGLDALEDDHVSALGVLEAVDEFVDEHPVADFERRDHAPRRDVKRLDDERPDEPEDEREGDEQDEEELQEPAPTLLARPARRAIGLDGSIEVPVLVAFIDHKG
jgi:hypothetical protein